MSTIILGSILILVIYIIKYLLDHVGGALDVHDSLVYSHLVFVPSLASYVTLVPSPHGVLRVVILSTLLGILSGPDIWMDLSLALEIILAHTSSSDLTLVLEMVILMSGVPHLFDVFLDFFSLDFFLVFVDLSHKY
jgi:hypothetical protein